MKLSDLLVYTPKPGTVCVECGKLDGLNWLDCRTCLTWRLKSGKQSSEKREQHGRDGPRVGIKQVIARDRKRDARKRRRARHGK